MDLFILFLISAIGLILGSFATVCIYRLPKNISVIKPRSFCTYCEKTINWFNNIPLLSFLLLKGRSNCCNKKISIIYPLTEFLYLFSIFFLYFYFEQIHPEFIFTTLFIFSLIILFFTDLKFFLLPNTVILFLYLLGLLRFFFINENSFFASPVEGIIGATAGIGFLYGIAKLYKIIRKKEGMGMGDIKLIGALGLWLGWKGIIFTIIISSILGIIIGISGIFFKKMNLQSSLPYGCFIIIAGIGYMFFRPYCDVLYEFF